MSDGCIVVVLMGIFAAIVAIGTPLFCAIISACWWFLLLYIICLPLLAIEIWADYKYIQLHKES